ncbi:aldehyde dehydrogenase family protein [Actinoplanes oblitus]|uniref:Aldehyde dehydrogenase family protein n=1 Tax=Actinoplanes oblitus TaxID=3040509 RepID=A0ABY8W545_9ACTN|nr:aldehyde dehydrogenase family protein [Actinoplanes oblitus]WIM92813.1 aldehyde dehydrogenase family protein [Actinoplanes oblitus]
MTTEAIQTVSDGELFIGGRFRPARAGAVVEDINPATGAPLCRVAWADETDLDDAVQAARTAFDEGPWPAMTLKERGELLIRIAEGMRERADELALRETLDVGKPITFSRGFDVPAAADLFAYYGGMVQQLEGAARAAGQSSFAYTRREPVGVVGAITPFNFPLNLAINKIAPALAAGNTVVHKPAEQTPLSTLLLAEIIADAGTPAGVYNVVLGDGPLLGGRLAEHPGVDKLAFTGSTATGKLLIGKAAGTLKKVTVELGGKGANIVFGDADLDAAAQAAFQAAFFNAGQFCMSGSRLLVHRSVHDELVDRLVRLAEATKIGDPREPETQLGPIAHQEQLDKVSQYLRIGQEEGATLRTGGRRPDGTDDRGLFLSPTIFTDVRPGMRIEQEEIFGPVLSVLRFDTDDEAVAIANGTPYGLAAGLHTRDLKRAHRTASRLQAGIVWINTWGQFESSTPFGGYKQSGYGRELGPEGIEEYLQYKTVFVNVD